MRILSDQSETFQIFGARKLKVLFNFRNKVSIVLFHVIKGMVPVLACYIKLWICTWNVRRALNLKLRLHTAINLADFLSW